MDGDDRAKNPLRLFLELLERAKAAEPADATAAALATADATGRPSARMVLLKDLEAEAFLFFTNYGSRKASDLEANPRAALCFHWPTIGYQVRVEGSVDPCSGDRSDAYFATRPRESQLAAWASRQSAPIASRVDLLARYEEMAWRFANRPVPRPPFWGGYVLHPQRIEIWRADERRLHHRSRYELGPAGWWLETLQP